MKRINLILFLFLTPCICGCKTYQTYYAEDNFENKKYGSIYESLENGDRIRILTKSDSLFECNFVQIKDDTLRAEEKNGPIKIPLVEKVLIRNVIHTIIPRTIEEWIGLSAVIALIASLVILRDAL